MFPKNFCAAPFIQHTTHPSKSFSPCPYLGGTVWNEEYDSIIDQWNSVGLEQLRQDFLNNNKSPICNRCWNEEAHSKKSLRLRLFDPETYESEFVYAQGKDFADTLKDSINTGKYKQGPIALTIKNGNVCNAKCRICHPGDSSKWRNDAVELKNLLGVEYYRTDQIERNWTDIQVDEIIELSDNLVRLELFGGEPLYNKKVYAIIEGIAKRGNAGNIVLYVNTNGSVNIAEKMPDVRHFKSVEIGVSVDGVGKQFEYGRHGLSYNQIVDNIKQMQDYFENNRVNYFIDSISTVSVLTVYYLPELKKAVKDMLPLAPFWNLLVYPSYLYIQNMPHYLKEKVIEKLSTDAEEFADLINILQQPGNDSEWEKFLSITASLDKIRNEDFSKTFPEFYELFSNEHKSFMEKNK
jgi:hypothetical protein